MDASTEFVVNAAFHGVFAFDVEHDPAVGPHDSGFRLDGCAFAAPDFSYYERDPEVISRVCRELFPSNTEAVAHNLKYDIKCLAEAGLIDNYEYPRRPVDTMVAANLLDENLRPKQLGLKALVLEMFDHKMTTFEEAWGTGGGLFELYANEDSTWTLALWRNFKPRLEAEGLTKLFERVLMPAEKVFADMEIVGIRWNVDGVRPLLEGFQDAAREMERAVKAEIGELNLDSGDQLAQRLFDELGYFTKGLERTPKGNRFSVDAKAMDVLARRHPVCQQIKLYRTAQKMISTYLQPLTQMATSDSNGRVHSTYWLVSVSGRTRCEKPNIQNVPAWLAEAFDGLDIRGNFEPGPGNVFLIVDYSQIELRLLAHVSEDPLFLKAYREWSCPGCGRDGSSTRILHRCPSCGADEDDGAGFWHGLDIHQQTTDMIAALKGDRQQGKRANFALIYGATARKMNWEYPEFSLGQWQKVIDEYFETYKGVRVYHGRMESSLWESGVCRDVLGRKRRIGRQEIGRNRKHAFNQWINFLPQSSACGMALLAMSKMRERWVEEDVWMRDISMVGFVHDEILFEAKEDRVNDFIPIVRQIMENVVQLRVPVRVDIKTKNNWSKAG